MENNARENFVLIQYLNTFCNWVKIISLHTKNSTILVSDPRTRALYFLINGKKKEHDYPHIYISEICTLCIGYHEKILSSENDMELKHIKSICREIYCVLLNFVYDSNIDFTNIGIIKSSELFQKSTQLIKKYSDIKLENDVQVEDISLFI